MKYLFLLLLCLSGCAGIQVNVDYDTCQPRGKLDGVKIYVCKYVDVK